MKPLDFLNDWAVRQGYSDWQDYCGQNDGHLDRIPEIMEEYRNIDTYQTIAYVDALGNVVGYRADTMGSINKRWGKVYKNAHKVFDRLKNTDSQSSHEIFAKLIADLNPDAAQKVSNDDSPKRYDNVISAQLLEFYVSPDQNFNENSYSTDGFITAISNAIVIDSFKIKKPN
jgi:hypothetical protein